MPSSVIHSTADLTSAFLDLLRRHERMVQKICGLYANSREDRQDLAGDIILQLWRAFPNYRGDAAASTWLYRVALNTALGQIRSASRRPKAQHHEEWLLQLPDAPPAEEDPNFQKLRAVITTLPDLERALVLLFLEERSHAEIAEITGLSISNVGTRLGRIKEKLRKLMTGHQSPANAFGPQKSSS